LVGNDEREVREGKPDPCCLGGNGDIDSGDVEREEEYSDGGKHLGDVEEEDEEWEGG